MSAPEMPVIDLGEISLGNDLFDCLRSAAETASREATLVRFMFVDTEITVAADSDIELIAETYWEYEETEGTCGKIGPYPAILTFDESKAQPYQLANWATLQYETVQAYQLGQEGWVETTDIRGTLCVVTFGAATDWHVKCANGKFEHFSDQTFASYLQS